MLAVKHYTQMNRLNFCKNLHVFPQLVYSHMYALVLTCKLYIMSIETVRLAGQDLPENQTSD